VDTIDPAPDPTPDSVVVTARDEQERIGATLGALREAFPGAAIVVADDGSRDRTAAVAAAAGATVLSARRQGKGAAATRGAAAVLAAATSDRRADVVLLCDADLGAGAARLGPLVQAVRGGEAELAVASFARPAGGGFGAAVGFARWALERETGRRLRAPISGHRALRADVLAAVLPFAPGFGMELAMTIDATRAGHRLVEIPLDLEHRATWRTARGFAHRGRQAAAFARAYAARAVR
jgi:glycosyltransferase involved in cell wall biosynthesis